MPSNLPTVQVNFTVSTDKVKLFFFFFLTNNDSKDEVLCMGKVLSGSLSVVLYKQILLSLCVCTGNVGFKQQKKGRNER